VKRSIYEINYERILPLISTGCTYKRFESDGFMDLVVEKISENEYSLAHYYEQNGDLMRDPEMTVRIYPGKAVEALTFTQDNLGIYQEVYPEPGKYVPYFKKELNCFLGIWLRNLKIQGFMKGLKIA
jgi:uncharacterized protein YqiB (DUF1249 family)